MRFWPFLQMQYSFSIHCLALAFYSGGLQIWVSGGVQLPSPPPTGSARGLSEVKPRYKLTILTVVRRVQPIKFRAYCDDAASQFAKKKKKKKNTRKMFAPTSSNKLTNEPANIVILDIYLLLPKQSGQIVSKNLIEKLVKQSYLGYLLLPEQRPCAILLRKGIGVAICFFLFGEEFSP